MSIYLTNAKTDLPLYKQDFMYIWDSINQNYANDSLEQNYHHTLLFKNWKNTLNHLKYYDCDRILEEIHQDINASFYLSNYGLFRTSLMHLRSAIELTMQLLYFHDHKIEYLQWSEGEFLIKHADLIKYLEKHPNFKDNVQEEIKKMLPQITKYWKEFSKYIHAEAPKYFHSDNQTHKIKTFNQAEFNQWEAKFQKSIYLLNKLMLLFFKNDFNKFPNTQREILMWKVKKSDQQLILKN